ncbi:methyl-accepting chemotaxis protein [Paenibacillus sp. 1_12]|uniref:methyl-accepting chemotaxis protein n=1 Tax=Paenibacillus sp. 1_12 TaxID=1566278 RepID=UPI0008EC9BDD|nr:methyl-accepting chemotaxis protein [Paenibacillus sp. 1_12]SFK68394.1 methyl-accepting chemotaxis protein [Paenibacillus sp. 1_12]
MKGILSVLKEWTAKISNFSKNPASKNESDKGASSSQRMKNSMSNLRLENPIKSVGMKLFLIFLVSILFFVLTVGFTSYNISKGVIQKKVADASEQTIIQAGQKLDIMYTVYEDLSMQILLDDEMKKLLVELEVVAKGSYDYLQLRQKISDKLNVYTYSNKTLKALHLFRPSGEPIAASGGSTSKETLVNEEWFKKITEDNGRATWIPTRTSGFVDTSAGSNTASFALGRVLKNTSTNSTQAVLLMEINVDAVGKELADIQMGEGGQTVIITPDMKMAYAPDKAAIGKPTTLDISQDILKDDARSAMNSKKDLQLVYYKSVKTGWYLLGAMPIAELVKDAKAISNITWIMAIVAALIAVGIGIIVANMIGKPVILLRNLMKEGEQGNLTVRMNVQSQDEIGQLGHSFNQMMEKITVLVQQTNQSAQEVLETATELSDASKKTATSAKEIAIATEEIAGGASSLAVESERGNELTHSIGMQMKAVVNSNIVMGTAASDVQKSSEQGIQYMSELILKTNATEEMTRNMVEKVDNLKESTRSIRKILEVLSNVSKQTNILSLNATIEAARAGAAGKGFMVVADEIRKLADQSRQSIAIVGQITETIQKEIDETVKALSNAYPIFQEQILSVKEADLIFKEVQNHMGGFIGQLSEVTESISQLDASQLVLNDAMTNVSAVAEESSATSQEVASLSSEQLNISSGLVRLSDKLEQLSNSLQESLSKFDV